MRSGLAPGLVLFLAACTATSEHEQPTQTGKVLDRLEFAATEDNIHHDTLLTQVTFDLNDGTFLIVASNVAETFEGLRLYRYRLAADSTVEWMAVSPPAYDSWTMLPTLFRAPDDSTAFIVLANFGEKESWGQEILRLDAEGFHDLGFLDVALPERVEADDTLLLKRRSIAPFTSIASAEGVLMITFTCDSIHLYDDQQGGTDRLIAATRLGYRIGPSGTTIVLDGTERPMKRPA